MYLVCVYSIEASPCSFRTTLEFRVVKIHITNVPTRITVLPCSLEVGSCIAVQVCMIQIPLLILFNAFYVSMYFIEVFICAIRLFQPALVCLSVTAVSLQSSIFEVTVG